jgi:hypothetical protein
MDEDRLAPGVYDFVRLPTARPDYPNPLRRAWRLRALGWSHRLPQCPMRCLLRLRLFRLPDPYYPPFLSPAGRLGEQGGANLRVDRPVTPSRSRTRMVQTSCGFGGCFWTIRCPMFHGRTAEGVGFGGAFESVPFHLSAGRPRPRSGGLPQKALFTPTQLSACPRTRVERNVPRR